MRLGLAAAGLLALLAGCAGLEREARLGMADAPPMPAAIADILAVPYADSCLATDCIRLLGDAEAARYAPQVGADLRWDQVGVIGSDTRFRLVVRIALGDTPHVLTPVLVEPAARDAPPRRLDWPDGQQLAVSRRGPYVRIAEEYTGRAPQILDLRTGRVVWPAAAVSGNR